MSASTMLTLSLEHDGFAVVEDVTDLEDIAVIHQAIENCLRRDDVRTRELGERGGAPEIIEIARPCLLAKEISRSRFFRNAKAVSEKYFEHEVVYHFDHAIIKPPMNQRETAWHQDVKSADKPAPSRPLEVVRRAFEEAGVKFIDENGGGPGVRLRKQSKGKSGK